MLAETFEDVRMKFIAEKVKHNPVELAFHAEGERWSALHSTQLTDTDSPAELWGTSAGRTKFWGAPLFKQ